MAPNSEDQMANLIYYWQCRFQHISDTDVLKDDFNAIYTRYLFF